MVPAIRSVGDRVTLVRTATYEHGIAWGEAHGVDTVVTDLEEALTRHDIDAVYIASNNKQHREHAETAAALGKHILAEKPLALDVADCRAMVAAAESAGVVLATNHPAPASSVFHEVRAAIDRGMVGVPQAVRIHNTFQLPPRLQGWRMTDAVAGGVVHDSMSHDAVAVNMLLDRVAVDVTARGVGHRDAPDVPEAVVACGLWEGDVLVEMHAAYNNGHLLSNVEVLGTEGALRTTNWLGWAAVESQGEILLWTNGTANEVPVASRHNSYERTLRAFRTAVAGQGRPIVSGRDGARAVAVTAGITASLANGSRQQIETI